MTHNQCPVYQTTLRYYILNVWPQTGPNGNYRGDAGYLSGQRGVALVDFPQTIQHLGQLRWVDGLHSNLDH